MMAGDTASYSDMTGAGTGTLVLLEMGWLLIGRQKIVIQT